MKKLKTISIISGVLTLVQLISFVLPPIVSLVLKIKMQIDMANAATIGIIGGADGPTAVFVGASNAAGYIRYGLLAATALVFVISSIMILVKKSKKR